jgi:hypothetical protein
LIYLSGASNDAVRNAAQFYPLGLIVQPGCKYGTHIASFKWWAADNACFAQGDKFDLNNYLDFLDEVKWHNITCLFATAPDVMQDAKATLDKSEPVLPMLRAKRYKAALVGQDGLESLEVPWEAFDAFFIGGSTEWKLSNGAAWLARQAKRKGKWVHMGRVNSYKRLAYAESIGCDSADGTFIKYGPSVNLPKVIGWLKKIHPELSLLDDDIGQAA